MQSQRKFQILVVDDHPAMRKGLRAIVDSTDDLVVCGEAANGEQAFAAVERMTPDVAIVDISLPGEDGFALTRRLCERWRGLPVLAFSFHEKQSYRDRALAAGAGAYCSKAESPDTLLDAVRRLAQGKSVGLQPTSGNGH